jgi:ornithine carbamoyltransferase
MGEEEKIQERIELLKAYRITQQLFEQNANPKAIFLHCLPSFHNTDTEISHRYTDICEVEESVFEGPQSKVFDQAENRMHTIKAVMVATIGNQ